MGLKELIFNRWCGLERSDFYFLTELILLLLWKGVVVLIVLIFNSF